MPKWEFLEVAPFFDYITRILFDKQHFYVKTVLMKKPAKLPELPNAQEAAILLLLLIGTRTDDGQSLTRIRLSELTLKRLWRRSRLNREFVEEVQEWLWHGGWSLFYAQTTYAAIKTASVQNWTCLSSKRMSDELKLLARGEFEFEQHQQLISQPQTNDGDD